MNGLKKTKSVKVVRMKQKKGHKRIKNKNKSKKKRKENQAALLKNISTGIGFLLNPLLELLELLSSLPASLTLLLLTLPLLLTPLFPFPFPLFPYPITITSELPRIWALVNDRIGEAGVLEWWWRWWWWWWVEREGEGDGDDDDDDVVELFFNPCLCWFLRGEK